MPVDKNSPRDPHLGQQKVQSAPATDSSKPSARAPGSAEPGRKKKQVRFSEVDSVTTYRPGESLAGHDLPVSQAAKPAAAAVATNNARPACAVVAEKDGTRSLLWPNGQRYHGHFDGAGAPHGEGTVRLADGHEHVSTWFHGVCTAVAGHSAQARPVEDYLPPTPLQLARALPAPPPGRAAATARALVQRFKSLGKKDER